MGRPDKDSGRRLPGFEILLREHISGYIESGFSSKICESQYQSLLCRLNEIIHEKDLDQRLEPKNSINVCHYYCQDAIKGNNKLLLGVTENVLKKKWQQKDWSQIISRSAPSRKYEGGSR